MSYSWVTSPVTFELITSNIDQLVCNLCFYYVNLIHYHVILLDIQDLEINYHHVWRVVLWFMWERRSFYTPRYDDKQYSFGFLKAKCCWSWILVEIVMQIGYIKLRLTEQHTQSSILKLYSLHLAFGILSHVNVK